MISYRDESNISQFQKSIRVSDELEAESEEEEKEGKRDKNSFADQVMQMNFMRFNTTQDKKVPLAKQSIAISKSSVSTKRVSNHQFYSIQVRKAEVKQNMIMDESDTQSGYLRNRIMKLISMLSKDKIRVVTIDTLKIKHLCQPGHLDLFIYRELKRSSSAKVLKNTDINNLDPKKNTNLKVKKET